MAGAIKLLQYQILAYWRHAFSIRGKYDASAGFLLLILIAFAFRYGLDIMRENGLNPAIIRAGKSNMFLSSVFTEAFVNATGVPVELYESDGSVGAAIGAGIGAKTFKNESEAFEQMKPLNLIEPTKASECSAAQ